MDLSTCPVSLCPESSWEGTTQACGYGLPINSGPGRVTMLLRTALAGRSPGRPLHRLPSYGGEVAHGDDGQRLRRVGVMVVLRFPANQHLNGRSHPGVFVRRERNSCGTRIELPRFFETSTLRDKVSEFLQHVAIDSVYLDRLVPCTSWPFRLVVPSR